jgi:hypothetical protein
MSELLTKGLISRKTCVRLFVACASFVLTFCLSSLTAEAGCSHHPDQRSADLPEGLGRIYEGGRFYHYKVIPPPCNGPNCGRPKSNSMTTMPSITTNDRQNSLTAVGSARIYHVRKPVGLSSDVSSIYSSPKFDELLRPPV